MPHPIGWIFEYFWLVTMLTLFANAGIWLYLSRKERNADPVLDAGYKRLIRQFLFWGNLPLIFIGAAVVTGAVPSSMSFLAIRLDSPITVAWFGLVFALWILGSRWMYFRGGAEDLAAHPAMVRSLSAGTLKVLWAVAMVAGVAGVVASILDPSTFPIP